jgi:hypothetical protein
VPFHDRGAVLAQKGFSVGPLAAARGSLFWEAAASDEADDVLLLSRKLATGKTDIVAHGVFQAFGLASTPGWIIYATRSGPGAQLAAKPLRGGKATVLSRALVAPFDARGDVVAWAEADTNRNRVMSRNMRSGARRVVYQAPRCKRSRCYRIDRVTVADAGVVFDLGSVGQGYPSLVGRRAWAASAPSLVGVSRDPQPDLVSAAAGALYYHFGHGWMEWPFDAAAPRPTWPHSAHTWLLSDAGPQRLALAGATCAPKATLRAADGRSTPVPSPRSAPGTPTGLGPLCRQVTGLAWSDGKLYLSWSLTPRVSVEAHEDIGVSGVISAVDVP